MTAAVLPFRPRPAAAPHRPVSQPCGAGAYPGFGVPVCGRIPARLHACGWRCDSHRPGTPKDAA